MKEVFDKFVRTNIKQEREDWDNLSSDKKYERGKEYDGKKWEDLSEKERTSAESPQKCKELCDSDSDCFQWMHRAERCNLSRSIKLGGWTAAGNNEKSVSGWNMERFAEFDSSQNNCSGGPDWHIRGI